MSGPWAHWDEPFDTNSPLLIDAAEYPRMRDATEEARSWFIETGADIEGITPGRPTREVVSVCDDHEEYECEEDDPCHVERVVWAFGGHQAKAVQR